MEFADQLSAIFAATGIVTEHDYRELGEEIAKAQGDRRPIPYASITIQGWKQGDLLPNSYTFSALTNILQDQYGVPEHSLTRLEEQFDTAVDIQQQQKIRPTELTHMMQTARKQQKLTFDRLAEITQQWNKHHPAANTKLPNTNIGIHHIFTGSSNNPVSKIFTYVFAPLLKTGLPENISLYALHEMQLREHADSLWEAAIAAQPMDLGMMVQSFRVRRGEQFPIFGSSLAHSMGRKEPFAAATVLCWESNKTLPADNVGRGHIGSDKMCEALIHLMQVTDLAPNALARGMRTPWFTNAMQQQFRSAFSQAMIARNSSNPPPSLTLCAPPDMGKVLPQAKVMQASLSGQLINGKEKMR